MPPLLSIVIPSFNYAHKISTAVNSVLAQTNEQCELLVIDDGSTDETPEVLSKLSSQKKFITIRQSNGGPAAARNHGTQASQGEFVLFLDADDELIPGAIEKILSVLEKNPATDLIIGGYISAFPDGRRKTIAPTPVTGPAKDRAKDYLISKRTTISHGCSVFRKALVEKRPYPENLRQAEDIPVFAYMLVVSRVQLINQPLVIINKHPDSLRHHTGLSRSISAKDFTRLVFAELPEECQSLKQRYEAQRNLSLFRSSYIGKQYQSADSFYREAFNISPMQALKWTYLKKYLRMRLFERKPIETD